MPTLNPVNFKPNELKPDDQLGLKIIAVIGHGKTWAAYRGLTDWSDEAVAMSGDKISKETAEALFYAIKAAGLHYRK